ncbi:MAG: pseudouridine synthase [Gammaproteobacteria bacterium]|nr:pseudouridine synthase [Gammaproteobacteria bacterium]
MLLNKPFRVLCQFRDPDGRAVLKDYVAAPDVYPAGRLDFDSEGLLLLTDNGRLQARISEPSSKVRKVYWAQVEGDVSEQQLADLYKGVRLKDGMARAVSASRIEAPNGLWDRQPPIRQRASIPDSWIEVVLAEGRNRQVRRMTATVGLPTLRLIRYAVGPWTLDGLKPGKTREISDAEAWQALQTVSPP